MMAFFLFAASLLTWVSASPIALADPLNTTSLLVERQIGLGCGNWRLNYRLAGKDKKGDITTVYYDEQASETLWCDPTNGCQESTEKSVSITLGAEFGASAPEEYWVNGGFSVEYSIEHADTQTCNSNMGSNTCVWYAAAYTQYTVQYYNENGCFQQEDVGEPVTIKSPNANNEGGHGWYCVDGTCRTKGQGYWH